VGISTKNDNVLYLISTAHNDFRAVSTCGKISTRLFIDAGESRGKKK